MSSSSCLNCSTPVDQNYCPKCGQKTSTHRYSIVHFVEHDFVHGVFHLDKGIIFTIRQLFTRPGHGVREFIQGKRQDYFSFVTLILFILAASALLAPYVNIRMSDVFAKESKAMMTSLEALMAEYPKAVVIITIPLYALFSFAWFNSAKLNFSEHLVLNSYRIIPELIFGLLVTLSTIFLAKFVVYILVSLATLFSLSYSTWFYYQFFSAYNYPKRMLIFRSVMIPLSYLILFVIVGIVSAIVQMIFFK